MYATPNPTEIQVAVIARDCVLPPRLIDRAVGIRGLVLGDGSFGYGALPVDAAAHERARDLSALRWEPDVLALNARVRRTHGLDERHSLAIAITQPRIRTATHTAFGLTSVFIVADGSITQRDHGVASLAYFDARLPACDAAP